jgi:nitric oxide dioxygenase
MLKGDAMLDQTTIDTVEATVPLLAEYGYTITKNFYEKMFTAHPELKNIFNDNNQRDGNQARALFDAVYAYANNLNSLTDLGPVVTRIAHKHVSLGVTAEQYPIVGKYLLLAIQDVLDFPNNHPAIAAWSKAYQQLADIFVEVEEDIYQHKKQVEGGWRGFKEFVIDDIVTETPEVKSFYLKPKDGAPLPSFDAGQYIGVKIKSDKSEYEQIRQYSLSGRPGDEHFRVTVKAEDQGIVSNGLHNYLPGTEVLVQVPTGVFTADHEAKKHVFIAGGVGITPLISMLYELLGKGVEPRDILFIQCQRDEQHQIFKNELTLLHKATGFNYRLCYQESDNGDYQGRLSFDVLDLWLQSLGMHADEETAIYFCGPKLFMKAMKYCAAALGFTSDRVHYESFGPTTQL